MSIKYKRRAPAKLIVMGVLFVVMALAATAGIVAVLAATSRSITSNVNITYTAVDIDGEVEAAYKIGDSGTWTSMNGSSPYRFAADDQTSNKQMNPADIELTSQNRYVEFRYIFRNYGHVDYTAILTLNEVDNNNNMKLEYKYNNNSYTPTGYGLVIEGTNSPVLGKVQTNEDGEEYVEMTYYVKASVKQLTRDANYQSDFFWLLENYEAQPGEETIRLATSEYSDNGDGTFSASYSGANISVASMMADDSTPSIENIWNVPSRFGSASVTKVKKGDELPANTKVVLSDSVTTIGETFKNSTGLVDIKLGNNITTIPENAFNGCSNLTKMEIPASVTTIGNSAFSDCSSIGNLEIPKSVTNIGSNVFDGVGGTVKYTVKVGETFNQDKFEGCENVEIELENGITEIPDGMFSMFHNLIKITIPNSVTSIGYASFDMCRGLTSVAIPGSVKSIGEYAFGTCSGLKNVVIEDGVTSLGEGVFQWCENLTSVTLPEGITSLNGAFLGCVKLTNVVIPDSVTNLSSTFFDCRSLTSVNIPEGVTSLDYTFYGCSNLTSIDIPEGVTNLDGTFYGCSNLTNIIIPEGVTSLDSTFSGCSNLTSIIIPEGLTSLDSTFSGCSSLTSIVISESVTYIGYSSFGGCDNLVSVEFKNPNGWSINISREPINVTDITISETDFAYNATLLKLTYKDYYWHRG